jgi:hypothetical protein
MVFSEKVSVRRTLACAVCVMSACFSSAALAQKSADSDIPEVKVAQVDMDAAHEAGPGRVHGVAANIPGAKEKLAAIHRERNASAPKPRADVVADSSSAAALTGPHFYPADLSSGGGPTLETTRMHAIFVNAPGSISSTWGNPEGFLRDLNESSFIQIADQYTGVNGEDRYPVGSHVKVRYGTPGTVLYELDIAAIVHAVASQHGAGGGNVYHVFLPPGTDTCFAPPTTQFPVPTCYSPDNPATNAFCGYHGAVQFSDIGIALFTVEPWLGPGSGCEIASPTPNGVLIDSTNNVLSHETFETITDPLPGLGFTNNTGGDLTGAEIGDECELFNFSNSPGAYTPPTFSINGKKYAVQPEYSNTYHACVTQP